ncbi:MAG: sulfotransferase domain-containing protein [Anaerolineae bacterium]
MTAFLPNVFILGAAKCGTSTLYAYLADMPGVCMAEPKEPLFFEAAYEQGLDYYRTAYFPHWQGEPLIGEARHRNLYLPYVPERIHATNTDAKLIVMVRNPIQRAFSHWWYWLRRGVEILGFREAIHADFERICAGWRVNTADEIARHCNALFPHGQGLYRTYLDSGYYYEQIMRYVDLFGMEQLCILLLEDLRERPEQVMADVARFLGVTVGTFRPQMANISAPAPVTARVPGRRIYNGVLNGDRLPTRLRRLTRAPAVRRWAKRHAIDRATRQWMRAHYATHNRRLGDLLNRDLSHWT